HCRLLEATAPHCPGSNDVGKAFSHLLDSRQRQIFQVAEKVRGAIAGTSHRPSLVSKRRSSLGTFLRFGRRIQVQFVFSQHLPGHRLQVFVVSRSKIVTFPVLLAQARDLQKPGFLERGGCRFCGMLHEYCTAKISYKSEKLSCSWCIHVSHP